MNPPPDKPVGSPPSAHQCATSLGRSLKSGVVAIALLVGASAPIAALPVQTVDGDRRALDDYAEGRATLALIIHQESDIREAFRLVTLADSKSLPALLVAALPEDQKLKSAAIKRATSRFIQSDSSRERFLFTGSTVLRDWLEGQAAPGSRSFLLDARGDIIWSRRGYPTDADFRAGAFQVVQPSN